MFIIVIWGIKAEREGLRKGKMEEKIQDFCAQREGIIPIALMTV